VRPRHHASARSTRPTIKSIAIFLAVLFPLAVALAVACNWRLETRTPALEGNKVAPDFSLATHKGDTVTLDDLVANGPAVVVFYRGFW
jgi:hypothetical protein